MIEFMAQDADALPSPEQLTEMFGKHGWEMVQIIERDGKWTIYFQRRIIQS